MHMQNVQIWKLETWFDVVLIFFFQNEEEKTRIILWAQYIHLDEAWILQVLLQILPDLQ